MLACLITLDCAREDHVQGERALTPCLDGFREGAVTFTGAHAHTNTTLPSHVTMMTGLLMPEHGVTFNHCVPSKDHLLLTERLAAKGARCAGFVGVSFLEKLYASKIDGSDPFYSLPSNRALKKFVQRLGVRGSRRGAAQTADKALRWIRSLGDQDAFCWVHLFDTHMDYLAAEKWRRHYEVPEERSGEPLDETLEKHALSSYHPVQGELRPLEYYPRMYRAAISHTDEVLGRFFEALRAMGRYDDALIVVTADHGENLLEHGVYCSHPLLFEETIRVPLVVKFPGGVHGGEEVHSHVGHRDLMPTILSHFGLDHQDDRCVNLAHHLGARDTGEERALFAFHNKMTQASVRRGPWVYIENLDLGSVRSQYRSLYDKVGLFDRKGTRVDDPDREAEMSRMIHAYLETADIEHHPAHLEEDEIKSHLQELGYL